MNSLLKNQAYINGRWVDALSGQLFSVLNPADDSVIAEIADIDADDARQAISFADQAFSLWSNMPMSERGKILRKWAQLIRQHSDELAELLTMEQGKPLQQSKSEVEGATSVLMRYISDANRLHGQTFYHDQSQQSMMNFILKQAVGVVAIIVPWNFPISLFVSCCAAALAAGCTVVIKPAQDTPLTALALTKLADEASLPAGVLNVLTCLSPAAVGEVLCQSPTVRKLAFTGSTAAGKLLLQQCASTVKNVCLELGGNSPFIIFADADIDQAVSDAVQIKRTNSGQICVTANRFFIEESVYQTVTDKISQRFADIKVGNGLDQSSEMGPLINQEAVNKVDGIVQQAIAEGAHLVTGGQRMADKGKCFYQPQY